MLIGVLIVLALAALGAVEAGQRLVDSRQRDTEEELLFVGEQYRQAILSYWRQGPGGAHSWPMQLEDLVEDRRFPQPRRHLRKLYADPMAPQTPWAVVRSGNGVIGVYSQAGGVPFRQTGFAEIQKGFDNAQRYSEWRFTVALPVSTPAPKPSNPGGPRLPSPSQRGVK
jgi:type II secretory pathway pseudopilin PulG